MSKKKTVVDRNCRDAVKRLHEVMKSLDIAKMNLTFAESRYSMALAFFSLCIGFSIVDFVAATTVVYTVGPDIGMKTENVFWNPEGGDFMNFTWFGLALVVSIAFALLSLCYCVVCSSSRGAARKNVKEMNEKLRDAKSAILEACPMELWYSGEA